MSEEHKSGCPHIAFVTGDACACTEATAPEPPKYPVPEWVKERRAIAERLRRQIFYEKKYVARRFQRAADTFRRAVEKLARIQEKERTMSEGFGEELKKVVNRELDWAVWEKVLGHVLICKGEQEAASRAVLESFMHYSTDISVAMEVVEEMRAKGWRVSIDSSVEGSNYEWHVEFHRAAGPSGGSFGVSLPETICRAAVATVQQEKGEGPVMSVDIIETPGCPPSPFLRSSDDEEPKDRGATHRENVQDIEIKIDDRLKALYMLVLGADMKNDEPATIAAQSLLFPSLGAAQSWAMVYGAPPPAHAYIVKLPIELIVFSAEPEQENEEEEDDEDRGEADGGE